jgi:hypothetical protein
MMIHKLRNYIDELFLDAPPTKKTVEVKEEILQNLIDKYNDLLSEGKSEEAAYNIAVASVGDMSSLIEELKGTGGYGAPQDEERRRERKRSALMTSIAVSLYILCIIPPIFADEKGLIVMLLMIAGATGLLIYNNMTKDPYLKREESIAEEFQEWRAQSADQHQLFKAVSSALWAVTVAIYMLISFWTHAWHITWIIFLIAAAANSILKAVFDLKK